MSESSLRPALALLPAPRRAALSAVYEYLRQVDDAVDELPADEGRRAVRALRDSLDDALAGRGALPVAIQMADTLRTFSLERPLLDRIVEAIEGDLEPARVASEEELRAYAAAVAGNLGVLLLPLLGVEPIGAARRYAHELGTALQLVNIVRDAGEDAARGRCYVPSQLLRAHGASEIDLLSLRDGAALRAALAELRTIARHALMQARALLPAPAEDRLRVAETMADLYAAQLDRLDRSDASPFASVVGPLAASSAASLV